MVNGVAAGYTEAVDYHDACDEEQEHYQTPDHAEGGEGNALGELRKPTLSYNHCYRAAKYQRGKRHLEYVDAEESHNLGSRCAVYLADGNLLGSTVNLVCHIAYQSDEGNEYNGDAHHHHGSAEPSYSIPLSFDMRLIRSDIYLVVLL